MTRTRSLALTATAALAAGLILTGCSTTPSVGAQATPTAGVPTSVATAAPTTAGVAATPVAPALTGIYRTSTGATIRIDPTQPLPADVIADLRARIPAGVPLTRDATLAVAMASDAAVSAVEAAGREIVGILGTGIYDQSTGAVAGQAWALIIRPDLRPSGVDQYSSVDEARAAASAVIAAQADPSRFDLIDLTS